jgi:hypothetical protein
MTSRAVRAALGAPQSVVREDAGTTVWRYTHRGDTILVQIAASGDSVLAWSVAGAVSSGLTPRSPAARLASAEKPVAARVDAYLWLHPETAPAVAYSLYRGRPQRGWTPLQLLAAWGPPREVDSTMSGDQAIMEWRYIAGIEGQYESFQFVRDSLARFTYEHPFWEWSSDSVIQPHRPPPNRG